MIARIGRPSRTIAAGNPGVLAERSQVAPHMSR